MELEHSLRATLTQLQQVLSQLSNEEYGKPLEILSNASIGQHTRHIIEFFQALTDNYEAGVFNYDKRKRNRALETGCDLAQQQLSEIMTKISRDDKEVLLIGNYGGESSEECTVRSTYYREVVYNLEHAVHHMAMIKIAIRQSGIVSVPQDFGVAAATIRFQKSIS